MADLALLLQLGERAELVGERDLGVDAVQLDQVDPVDPEVAQRSSTCCLRYAGRPTAVHSPGPVPGEAGLGGDDQVVGVGVQRLGDDLLADDRAVGVGGVDEVDALLDGGAERRAARRRGRPARPRRRRR